MIDIKNDIPRMLEYDLQKPEPDPPDGYVLVYITATGYRKYYYGNEYTFSGVRRNIYTNSKYDASWFDTKKEAEKYKKLYKCDKIEGFRYSEFEDRIPGEK